MGSPLATSQVNHCLLPTHQPEPTASRKEPANSHGETPGAVAPGFCWADIKESDTELSVNPGGTHVLKSHLHTPSASMSQS